MMTASPADSHDYAEIDRCHITDVTPALEKAGEIWLRDQGEALAGKAAPAPCATSDHAGRRQCVYRVSDHDYPSITDGEARSPPGSPSSPDIPLAASSLA